MYKMASQPFTGVNQRPLVFAQIRNGSTAAEVNKARVCVSHRVLNITSNRFLHLFYQKPYYRSGYCHEYDSELKFQVKANPDCHTSSDMHERVPCATDAMAGPALSEKQFLTLSDQHTWEFKPTVRVADFFANSLGVPIDCWTPCSRMAISRELEESDLLRYEEECGMQKTECAFTAGELAKALNNNHSWSFRKHHDLMGEVQLSVLFTNANPKIQHLDFRLRINIVPSTHTIVHLVEESNSKEQVMEVEGKHEMSNENNQMETELETPEENTEESNNEELDYQTQLLLAAVEELKAVQRHEAQKEMAEKEEPSTVEAPVVVEEPVVMEETSVVEEETSVVEEPVVMEETSVVEEVKPQRKKIDFMDVGEIPIEDLVDISDISDFLPDESQYYPQLSYKDNREYFQFKSDLDELLRDQEELARHVAEATDLRKQEKEAFEAYDKRRSEEVEEFNIKKKDLEERIADCRKVLKQMEQSVADTKRQRDTSTDSNVKMDLNKKLKEMEDIKKTKDELLAGIIKEDAEATAAEDLAAKVFSEEKALEEELEVDFAKFLAESEADKSKKCRSVFAKRIKFEVVNGIRKFRKNMLLRYLKYAQLEFCERYEKRRSDLLTEKWGEEDAERNAENKYREYVDEVERGILDRKANLNPGLIEGSEYQFTVSMQKTIVLRKKDVEELESKIDDLEKAIKQYEHERDETSAFLEALDAARREEELSHQEFLAEANLKKASRQRQLDFYKSKSSALEEELAQLAGDEFISDPDATSPSAPKIKNPEYKNTEIYKKVENTLSNCNDKIETLEKEIEDIDSAVDEKSIKFQKTSYLGERERAVQQATYEDAIKSIEDLIASLNESEAKVEEKKQELEQNIETGLNDRKDLQTEISGSERDIVKAALTREKENKKFVSKMEKIDNMLNESKDDFIDKVMRPIPKWDSGILINSYNRRDEKEQEDIEAARKDTLASLFGDGVGVLPDGLSRLNFDYNYVTLDYDSWVTNEMNKLGSYEHFKYTPLDKAGDPLGPANVISIPPKSVVTKDDIWSSMFVKKEWPSAFLEPVECLYWTEDWIDRIYKETIMNKFDFEHPKDLDLAERYPYEYFVQFFQNEDFDDDAECFGKRMWDQLTTMSIKEAFKRTSDNAAVIRNFLWSTTNIQDFYDKKARQERREKLLTVPNKGKK